MQNGDSNFGGVREQLILAGIDEIKEHGIVGFSQRRVAAACHVSCAAPYKWFGSREGLVQAVREYIDEQWELFARGLIEVYKSDGRRLMTELSLGYLSFLNANPKFRTVLLYCDEMDTGNITTHIPPSVNEAVEQYARSRNMSRQELEMRRFMVYSAVIGASMLPRHEEGKFGLSEEEYNMVYRCIEHAVSDPLPILSES